MVGKAEQSEATRRALIAAARMLFAAQGFADTSVDEITAAAGVTKGALYHQFRDKAALFEAVFENVETDVVEGLLAEVSGLSDPLRILRRGFDAFLDLCLDPAVQRIALIDAPAVLGWQRWRELEQAYGLGIAKLALQGAMDAGVIKRQAVDPLAHVLFGALIEAGLLLANSPDPAVTRKEVGRPVQGLVDALRTK